MATAAAADKVEAPAKKSPMGKLIPIVAAAIVAAGATGAGVFFVVSSKSAPKAAEATPTKEAATAAAGAHKPAQYLSLTPSFVINLEDDQAMRYLQVDIELMTRDPKAIEDIKNNLPRIRNALMMLFTQQHYHDIVTREGKEKLQQQALDEVQKVLKEESGSAGVEGLYFTNFVMQ